MFSFNDQNVNDPTVWIANDPNFWIVNSTFWNVNSRYAETRLDILTSVLYF